MARKEERNKLYEELDAMKTGNEGFISYREFKIFVQEAEGEKASKENESRFRSLLLLLSFDRFLQES